MAADPAHPTSDESASSSRLVRALPWLIAVGLVGYLASTTDLAALGAQVRDLNVPAYAAFIVAGAVLNLLTDSLGTWKAYRRIAPDIEYRSIVVVRGASYLPTIINYHVGQAYLTWLLARRHAVPIGRAASGTILVYVTVLLGLVLMTAGTLVMGDRLPPWLLSGIGLGLAGAMVYLLVLVAAPRWVREQRLLAPLFDAGVRGHLELLVFRAPHLLVLFASLYGSYVFFGITLPLGDALAIVPALLLVTAVPLTPQGLGTREVVAIALLTPFAATGVEARAAILASGTLWTVAMSAVQAVISLILAAKAARILGSQARTGGSPLPAAPPDRAPR